MRIRHSKLGSGYVLTDEAQSRRLVVAKHKPSYEEEPHHVHKHYRTSAVLIATAEDICKNGHNYKGARKYHCHRCKSYGTLHARQGYREEEKELILRAYPELASMRGVERIFGTVRQTLARWIREKAAKLPAMEITLLAAEPDDVLELDELWSFVRTKRNQRWVWIALCRRTRQVVACFIGDRSADSCRALRHLIPQSYNSCCSCSVNM